VSTAGLRVRWYLDGCGSLSLQRQLGVSGRNVRCAEFVVTLAVGNAQVDLAASLKLNDLARLGTLTRNKWLRSRRKLLKCPGTE
jgi:hypothetical protein